MLQAICPGNTPGSGIGRAGSATAQKTFTAVRRPATGPGRDNATMVELGDDQNYVLRGNGVSLNRRKADNSYGTI